MEPSPEPISIDTSRLVIRRFRKEDASEFFKYRSDPSVSRYQSWQPKDEDDSERFVEANASLQIDLPGTWLQLAIILKGNLIGDCAVRFPADDRFTVEIGFTPAPVHQGRGYATEAVTALLDYIFDKLGKHRVYGSVDPRNLRSIALMERIRMRKEAHFRKSVLINGAWADDIIFAILEEEWAYVRKFPKSVSTARRQTG